MTKIGFENEKVLLGEAKGTNTYGPEVATDGALENWETSLQDFGVTDTWGWDYTGTGGTARVTRSADANYGSYAAKLETKEGFGDSGAGYSRPFIMLKADVSTASTSLVGGLYAKGAGGGEIIGLTLLNGDQDNFTKAYNWTTDAWTVQADIDALLADTDYVATKILTGAYAEYFTETFNKDGNTVCFFVQNNTAGLQTVYIDDMFIEPELEENDEKYGMYPTGWFISGDDYTSRPVISKASDSGSYAVKTNGSEGVFSIVSYGVDSLTPSDSYTLTARAKSTSGTSQIGFAYSYEDGEDEYMWNFTGASAGTWTLVVGETPTADQMDLHTATSSYTTIASAGSQVLVPAGGAFNIIIASEANDVFLDNATFKEDGTGDNILTNSGFEAWTVGGYASDGSIESAWGDYVILTSWNCDHDGDLERSTDSHGGTYSAQMTLDEDHGSFIQQIYSSLTQDDWYRVSLWAKYEDTSSRVGVVAFNDDFNSATQYYDFDTETWTALGSPATSVHDLTTSFAQYSDYIKVPASGKINVVIMQAKEATNDVTIYVDDISFKKVTFPTSENLFDFSNPSDAANLDSDDMVFEFATSGGTPKTFLSLDPDGKIGTDLTELDFKCPVKVEAGTDPSNALNQTTGMSVLASVGSINFLNTGQTTLYTVPAGKTLYIDHIVLELTAQDTIAVQPTIRVGISPNYSDFMSNLQMADLTVVGNYRIVTGGASTNGHSHMKIAAGSVVALDITTAATATAYTGKVSVIGYLV